MTSYSSNTNVHEWKIALVKQPKIISKVMNLLPFSAQDLIKISRDLHRRPLSNNMIQKCMSDDACAKLQPDTYRRLAQLFAHLEINVKIEDGEYTAIFPPTLAQATDLSHLDRHQVDANDCARIRISREHLSAINQYCKKHRLRRASLLGEILEVGFQSVTGESLPGAIAPDPAKDLYRAGFGLITEAENTSVASDALGLVIDDDETGFGLITEPESSSVASDALGLVIDDDGTDKSQPLGFVCE